MKTGENVDRFTILKKLGHGGMGGVFIGFDHQSDELVAVKILFQEYADDEVYVKRFQREIAILRSLVHPNVVRLVDAGVDKDLHYMALEYVRGKPLSDLITSRKRIPLEIALKLAKDVARALAYAHSNAVVHRDIKPANIMVIEQGWTAKILDFGVAHAEDQLLETSTGRFVGTLSYAAPEQVMGKPIDERADLYAMGLVIYEMLTGRKALIGSNQAAILQQQLGDSFIPPNQIEQSLPSELNNLVLKLLRCDPQHRYQKCDQFLYDLELFESRYKSMAFHSRSVYDFPEFVKDFQEANAAFEHKDFDTAHRLALDLSKKAPRAAEVFFLLGKIQVERGLHYNAIQDYLKATLLDPDNTYYHMSLGIAYQAIGMREQARQELEAALKLDPNSLIVRQRLDELDHLQAQPVQPLAQGATQAAPDPRDGRVGFLEPSEAEKAAMAEQAKREREPLIALLRDRRPPAKSRVETAVRTALWWGGGFRYLGAERKVLVPSILQGLAVVVGLYLLWNPGILQSLAGSSRGMLAAAEYLKDRAHMFYIVFSLYVVATAYFVNEAAHDAHAIALQGYVVQERSERQWVMVNVGRDRGARVLQIFHVFREEPPGSGRGLMVGRILTKEVGDDYSSGPYYPDTRDPIAFGMFCVAQEAIRLQLVDPTAPAEGRFVAFEAPAPIGGPAGPAPSQV